MKIRFEMKDRVSERHILIQAAQLTDQARGHEVRTIFND